jgi:hypothetical protein
MVGLGNVNNTSDANKPVSNATQTALDLKAPLNSPAFTGTVTGVTSAMVGLGMLKYKIVEQTNFNCYKQHRLNASTTNLALKSAIEFSTFTDVPTSSTLYYWN